MAEYKAPKVEPMSRLNKAELAKQRGIAVSYEHASELWKDEARSALYVLATTQQEFTTDQLWDILAERGVSTVEPRALGGIMLAASKSRIITSTGKYVASYRRHKAPIILWRSNIYQNISKQGHKR